MYNLRQLSGRANDCGTLFPIWWYTLCMSTTKKRKETRTYADRKEYMKKAVIKRRKKLRQMALEYGGGKCIVCKYDKCKRALGFHHLDPKKKEFGISSKGITRSWEKTRKEIDKCVLLCANCHMEVHEGITQLPTEMQVEERGELSGNPNEKVEGNQQPSFQSNLIEGSETIPQGSSPQSVVEAPRTQTLTYQNG